MICKRAFPDFVLSPAVPQISERHKLKSIVEGYIAKANNNKKTAF